MNECALFSLEQRMQSRGSVTSAESVHRGHHNMTRKEEGNMRYRRKSAFAQERERAATLTGRMSETL